MELKDFDFHLPESLIAQRPLDERDSSRLMVLERATGSIAHRVFRDIPGYFREGDLLILNNTRVIPTRVLGRKETGGKVELLLVKRVCSDGSMQQWTCMAKPSKGLRKGSRVIIKEGVAAEITGVDDEGFFICSIKGPFDLEAFGSVPLPPYIKREAVFEDKVRYQTVYAGVDGAVAAPTAGLHFTDRLLEGIKSRGVDVRYITLHTGPGTFMPVRTARIEEHRMLREGYSIPVEVFEAVKKAKEERRRVIAVGTTSTRALEASAANGFEAPALEGATGLFIYPGFRFRVVDALVTNFHLPGSTLIMLASAFAGHASLMRAYEEAVRLEYRFFSYGDAMLII